MSHADVQHMLQRLTNLEKLVSSQAKQIKQLQTECQDLTQAAAAFARVVELLREAGLQPDTLDDQDTATATATSLLTPKDMPRAPAFVSEYRDIFGAAPASVIEAADTAGASILAGMLGGKQRLLVDVRDADLSQNPETLVQFIELAILPVAAGLEGLAGSMTRNRLKIVFPTVGQLSEYRNTMALAAPEVVALSTLGFDPVEPEDNLVVIVAPAPDDEEGLQAMNELLAPSDPNKQGISQPVVVLNHYMVPVTGPAANFEVAYHLRLLSVQYMSDANAMEYFKQFGQEGGALSSRVQEQTQDHIVEDDAIDIPSDPDTSPSDASAAASGSSDTTGGSSSSKDSETPEDEALEAAMKHAHEVGMQQGVTRGMVIRAYPKPWHVFVDTSPDTDADFQVAATFDEEPSADDVYIAIVECLEGSEREDDLVAQQMQEALETGQLDRISEMLGTLGLDFDQDEEEDDDDDDEDDLYGDFGNFEEDSV